MKVGAVLVKDDRIISVGYNGTPTGWDNDCEDFVPGETQHEHGNYVTKPEVLHAEENVVAFAARNGMPTDGCIMVTTASPCFQCSRLLIQAGIKEVYYRDVYRKIDGISFLEDYGIKVERIKDEATTNL